MKKSYKIVRDEHGYINNRGRSKYWGVSFRTPIYGNDEWIVSYHALDVFKQTHTLIPVDFKLTEQDAARIAAFYYEQGQVYNPNVSGVRILSADGKYIFSMNNSTHKIYRGLYSRGMKVYEYKPNLLLPLFEQKVSGVDLFVDNIEALKTATTSGNSQLFVTGYCSAGDGGAIQKVKKPRAKTAPVVSIPTEEYIGELTARVARGEVSERAATIMIAVLGTVLNNN